MSQAAARTGPPGEVTFVDEGVVSPSKASSILASLRDPNSVVGEELRLLRSRLGGDGKAKVHRCLALTSALPGEGKSTLALGLAAAFAREAGRRVLLIEGDLRRPTVAEVLGLPPALGLGEWLAGKINRVPVRRVRHAEFSLLVAGQCSFDRPEVLGSPAMDSLLQVARKSYDRVILDVPPLLPVADATLLQDLIDAFVLVVRSRVTPRDAITEALKRLHRDRVVGVVLNDHKEYRHSYSSYAYYRYGMSYGPGGSKPGGERR